MQNDEFLSIWQPHERHPSRDLLQARSEFPRRTFGFDRKNRMVGVIAARPQSICESCSTHTPKVFEENPNGSVSRHCATYRRS